MINRVASSDAGFCAASPLERLTEDRNNDHVLTGSMKTPEKTVYKKKTASTGRVSYEADSWVRFEKLMGRTRYPMDSPE